LKQEAKWAKETGDTKTAAELFIACKDYRKAIEIYG
jgi:intraflagellar transport protein 122